MNSLSKSQSGPERTNWTFGKLFDWHLERGTRPGGGLTRPGKQWSSKEFASRLQLDPKTVRNWRTGRNIPDDIGSVERELFGDNDGYDDWKVELRRAHLSNRRKADVLKNEQKVIALPYLSLGGLFKGREQFLEQIRTSLARDGGGRATICVSALYGLGGIGKTRAAVEYAWLNRERYSAILFVAGETAETLQNNFAALSSSAFLDLGASSDKTAERAGRVKSWLRANPGWLIIVDGVDTRESLSAISQLLQNLEGGQVLITARMASFPAYIQALKLLEISPEDAAIFLLERTDPYRSKADNDTEVSRAIAGEDLECLPLALEQAAAYISKNKIGLEDYRSLWKKNWEKVAGWADVKITNYPHSLAVTWQTSVDQLSEESRYLLARLSWFASAPIPSFLFDLRNQDRDSLSDLLEYSLARSESAGFSIHRLLREVTRRSFSSEMEEASLWDALVWLRMGAVGVVDELEIAASRDRVEGLAPHALSLLTFVQPANKEVAEHYALIAQVVGYFFFMKGIYGLALSLLTRATEISETYLGDHALTVVCLNSLGDVREAIGEFTPGCSLELFQRALQISEFINGPEHRETAASLHNVAFSLQMRDRAVEAKPLLERALAIRETVLGFRHPHTCLSRSNLAAMHLLMKEFESAERLLAATVAALPSDHPQTAMALSLLAAILENKGDRSGAKRFRKQALSICEVALGADHPWTKNLKNGL